MTNTNKNIKPFYNTPIPCDWKVKKLKEILLEGRLGGNYENAESNLGLPVIKMGNLDRGTMKFDNIQYLPQDTEFDKDDILKAGDLLFNTRNTLELVGKVAIWNNELPLALYNSNLMRMKFNEEIEKSNWFMNYAFNSHYGLSQLRGIATGTTSVAAIYGRDLQKITFLIPPLPEQRIIAKALSLMDTAINKNNQLVAQKELRKKWLMQNLLTGKLRLKGFSGEWQKVHIRDVSKEVSIRNKDDKQLTVLSCTKYDGLVPSLEYFGRKIYSDNLDTYKVVPKGHFAYATNHIEEGSIGYQSDFEEALISPMYTIFKTDDTIDDVFFYRLLKSHRLIYEYNARMEGSIDRRGGLRWDAFSIIKVKLPKKEEQTAIAKVLQAADKEIELLKAKTDKLKEQKKGMMQVLLTGKKRLKVE
jgi:type I restriction enzyme S subunit